MDSTQCSPLDPIAHSYGTRIRKNTSLKPSARLRSLPDPTTLQPRRLKPTQRAQSSTHSHYPQFPLPGIVLHPDDATSKVFIAIGRSFLSVNNRAMTIKDLAEMTVRFGLVCQNVSAASQAITTYIRTHMHRCEVQQDQPLLLRHVLSGTAADDDLLPALHSRSGGAHCTVSPDNRITNFRRGTMVWYLSRSTGAPCPFARVGIRLCDYGEDGRSGNVTVSKDKRQRDRERRPEHCGEKRKRPLRSCVARGSDSESPNDDEGRPPKVKLTLRLRPLNNTSPSSDFPTSESRGIIDLSNETDSDSDDSSSDAMSVDSSEDEEETRPSPPTEEAPWSLPPYPRRSISIPCYTPCTEEASSLPRAEFHPFRRSPSIPYSVGSPPPDSEDEDEDFHITMTGARRHSTAPRSPDDDPEGWDADLDSEDDGEILSESPGPASPYAHMMLPEVIVKEEPTDLQGMLDAWEDFDCSLAGAKVVEVIAQAAACVLEAQATCKVKAESMDSWMWESSSTDQEWRLPSEGLATCVKQEEVEVESPFSLPHGLFSLSSPLPSSSQLPGLSYSPSPSPESSRDDEWIDRRQFSTVRAISKMQPSPISVQTPSSVALPWMSQRDFSVSRSSSDSTPSPMVISQSLAALIQSMSMNSPTTLVPSSLAIPPHCISPLDTRCKGPSPENVVVQTCQPCHPPISATQIEGISVYQMTLGSHLLLRRIDTDFVNLTPIVTHANTPHPVVSTIANAVTVAKGSPAVSGTWVPLPAAQAYIHDHPALHGGPYDIFLSDSLSERFPLALQEFNKSSAPGRTLNHFGPHFGSTLQATQLYCQTEAQNVSRPENDINSCPAVTALTEDDYKDLICPLNAEEQELFREICDIPDTDKENSPVMMAMDEKVAFPIPEASLTSELCQEQTVPAGDNERPDRPLRRSKRVADAVAAQSPSRTRRGGSRNSLS